MPLRFSAFWLGAPLAVFAASAIGAGEAPETVLERMAQASSAGKALEMDYVLIQYRDGRRVEARGTAQYHADGKRFVNQVKTQAGDQEVDVRMICDGTVIWVEVREGERIMGVQKFTGATLQKLGGAAMQDPKHQVDDLRGRYTFSEAREGKMGATPVTVLEGTVRPEFIDRQIKAAGELGGKLAAELATPQIQAMVKVRVSVESQTGRIRKSEVFDKDGQLLISFEVERVKSDAVFAEDLFAYTPPKDVEVVDLDRLFQAAR